MKKAWDLHKNTMRVVETHVQACEKSSDLPSGHITKRLSHLGQIANMHIREVIVDSVASLHMTRKNELTSGERDTRRSKKPPPARPPTERQSRQCTSTMMLLEDSKQCYLFVFIARRNGLLFRMEERRVSIMDSIWKSDKVQV